MEELPEGLIQVSVLKVHSPSDFLVRPECGSGKVRNIEAQLFNQIADEINATYDLLDTDSVQVRRPTVGEIYAGYCYVDQYWYRVKVLATCDRARGIYARCYLVDYAEEKFIALKFLKPLAKKYFDVPFQVKRFALSDVKPLTLSMSPIDMTMSYKSVLVWDSSASDFLLRATRGVCLAQVVHVDDELTHHVRLYVADGDGTLKCFNDELVSQQYAEPHIIERSAPPSSDDESGVTQTKRSSGQTILGILAEKRLKKGGAVLETPRDIDLVTQTLVDLSISTSREQSDTEMSSKSCKSDAGRCSSSITTHSDDGEGAMKPRGRAARLLKALADCQTSKPGGKSTPRFGHVANYCHENSVAVRPDGSEVIESSPSLRNCNRNDGEMGAKDRVSSESDVDSVASSSLFTSDKRAPDLRHALSASRSNDVYSRAIESRENLKSSPNPGVAVDISAKKMASPLCKSPLESSRFNSDFDVANQSPEELLKKSNLRPLQSAFVGTTDLKSLSQMKREHVSTK